MFLRRFKGGGEGDDEPSAGEAMPAAPVAPAPPPTFTGTEQCSEPGCPSLEGAHCAYIDRRRVPCSNARCSEHPVVIGGAPYCPRHAGVVRALALVPEEEREYPDVDNRAPSLCEWMAHTLESGVQQILAHYQAQRAGSSLAPETLTLAVTGTPRVRGWEHRWRLVDHTGPLLTIALRVEEPRDSLVLVKVNGVACDEAVPPWIGEPHAASPEADAQRRLEFDQRLLGSIATASSRLWAS